MPWTSAGQSRKMEESLSTLLVQDRPGRPPRCVRQIWSRWAGFMAPLHVGLAAVLLGTGSLPAQAGDPKISSAPGGVPVPPMPGERANARVPADAAPLSTVFRVRVVDGRNGLPVDRAHLQLWYDETGGAAFALITNAAGVALMPAPVGTPVRVLLSPEDKFDCRQTRNGEHVGEPPDGYNLETLAAAGVATANHCGPTAVKPKPGELVLFVRSLRWYEGLNR